MNAGDYYIPASEIDVTDLQRRFPEATAAIAPLRTAYQRADALHRDLR